MATRNNCRLCGHQMSLHGEVGAPQSTVYVAPAPVAAAAGSRPATLGDLIAQRSAKRSALVNAAQGNAEPASTPVAERPDPTEKLIRLGEMRANGLLTDEEFATAKANLLN